MSKRFGRNQKRALLAEISRLRTIIDGVDNYKKDAVLQWPDLWNHFGMAKDRTNGKWRTSRKSQGYVVEFFQARTSYRSLYTNELAYFFLGTLFAKEVVKHDVELARKLGLLEK